MSKHGLTELLLPSSRLNFFVFLFHPLVTLDRRAPWLATSGFVIPGIDTLENLKKNTNTNLRHTRNAETIRDHRLRVVIEMARNAIGKLFYSE